MKKFVTILFAAILLFGCTSIFESYDTHTLRLEDKSANCKVGDVIAIELDSNPSTGYDWQPKDYNNLVLKLLNRKFQPGKALLGSPGVTRLEFEAIAEGEAYIKLQYVREWDNVPVSEAVFSVNVIKL